jgi:hypothetical protein
MLLTTEQIAAIRAVPQNLLVCYLIGRMEAASEVGENKRAARWALKQITESAAHMAEITKENSNDQA